MKTVIIGGGVSGMALGLLLKRLKQEVVVIERGESFNNGRVVVFSKKALKSIGMILGEKTWKKVAKMNFSQVVVWKNQDMFLTVPAEATLVERNEFLRHFTSAYVAEGGEIISGEAIRVDEKERLVVLRDGRSIGYDYLAVADGVRSKMRETLEPQEKRLSFLHVRHDYVAGDEGEAAIRYVDEIVPSGKDIKIIHSYNIAYIGEAAGLVDPISGETVAYALKSAEELAVSICNRGFDGCDVNDFYNLYTYHIMKEVRKRRIQKIFKLRSTLRTELFLEA